MIDAYLEIGSDGGYLAWSFDPLGCHARGMGEEEALAGLAEEINYYHRRAGIDAFPLTRGDFRVAGRVTRQKQVGKGDTSATFAPDLRPMTRAEVDDALAALRRSREDLLELIGRIPDALLDWRPGDGRRSLSDQIRHIAECERWYLEKFGPAGRSPRSRTVVERLAIVRQLTVDRFRGMSDEELAQSVKVLSETWTARKILRRCLYHERFHYLTIKRDLEQAGRSS
ncbi:MAG: DinB family protein [Bacillota bacterium]